MRKISFWAKYHPQSARIIIAIAELTLFILSVTLGILLLQSHILLHQKIAELSLLLITVSIIFYPYKSNHQKRYTLRKSLEFTLGLGIFMMGCFMTNRDKIVSWNAYTPLQGHYVSLYKSETKMMPEKKTMTKKEIRKEFKAWLKKEKKESKESNLTWLWITLILLGGIALITIVAAAACSIGCAGDMTGAWLVGLGGSALIIFFMYLGIHGITKHKKKQLKEKEQAARNKHKRVLTV